MSLLRRGSLAHSVYYGMYYAARKMVALGALILGNDPVMKEALAKQHLHGKLIEPERVASVVVFLFTDGASAINGSTIPVEDGFQIFKNS